jgi:polar amino acid transport system substrate-binding protein
MPHFLFCTYNFGVSMKKRQLLWPIFFSALCVLLINQYTKLMYDVNLLSYIDLSMPLSEEEETYKKSREVFVHGGNIYEPPLGIYEPETGQHLGLVVDYINALSIPMEVPIISKPMVWNDALLSLAQGKTDFCDLIPSEQRAELFEFSNPLYQIRGLVVLRSDNAEIKTVLDLENRKVAAPKGDYSIEALTSKVNLVTMVEVSNLGEALKLLDEGSVDAVIGDEPVIWYLIKELSIVHQYKILDTPLYDEPVVIAVPKGETNLIKLVNRSILVLRSNGTLDQINEKWRAYAPLLTTNKTAEKWRLIFAMTASGMALTLSGFLMLNRKLKLIIEEKTADLQFTFDSLDRFAVVLGDQGLILNANRAILNYLSMDKNQLIGTHSSNIEIIKSALEALGNHDVAAMHHIGRYYEVKSLEHKLLTIQDMTFEKTKERQLIQSNRMEAIGQLATGVAHELRNPLGVIRNSTYLLEDIGNQDEAIRDKGILAINRAVNRASSIIDNLLNFSRLSSSEEKTFLIKPVLEELVEFYTNSKVYDLIAFELACSDRDKITVSDEAFRHILNNLIANACDAIAGIGQITIRVETDRDLHGKPCFKISIQDTGIGISIEEKDKIFEPFYTTKAPGKGTGLGLYIVYSEVMAIGGAIDVQSELGIGTTFVITLASQMEEV